MEDNLSIVADSQPDQFAKGLVTVKSHGSPLTLDLHTVLPAKAESTYLFQVHGHHWADQGILDGDIALVDRARLPMEGDLVISWQSSGFSICRYWQLLPEDNSLGVISAVIRRYPLSE
jgi:hypothetical protein